MEPQNPFQPPYKAPGEPTLPPNQGQNTGPVTTSVPRIDSTGKTIRRIFGINILIFAVYFILLVIYANTFYNSTAQASDIVPGYLMMFFLGHAAVLGLLAIVNLVLRRFKIAAMFFFMGCTILVIGFGSCTFATMFGAFGKFEI